MSFPRPQANGDQHHPHPYGYHGSLIDSNQQRGVTTNNNMGSNATGGGGLMRSVSEESDPNLSDGDSDLDQDELTQQPLTLTPDDQLAPPLRKVIQKYRLKHYLNYKDLIGEGFYDDGGVVFVTTSHVAKQPPPQRNGNIGAFNSTRPQPHPQQQPQQQLPPPQPVQQPAPPPQQKSLISLFKNRLSFASPPPQAQPPPQPVQQPPPTNIPSPHQQQHQHQLQQQQLEQYYSAAISDNATSSPPTFKPYKQWAEETVLLDSRIDANLRSATEEAKRLLVGVSDMKARIMLLALFVSNKLGGGPKDIVKEWQTTITRLRKVYGRHHPTHSTTTASSSTSTNTSSSSSSASSRRLVIPLGALIGRVGLSRHRALLFKYLCDQTVLYPDAWAPSPARPAATPREETPRDSPTAQILQPVSPNINIVKPTLQLDFIRPPNQSTPDIYSSPLPQHTSHEPASDDEKMGQHDPLPHAHIHMTPINTQSSTQTQRTRGVSVEGADAEVERTNNQRSRSPSTENNSSQSQLNIPQTPNSLSSYSYPSIHCRLMRGQYEYHFPRSRRMRHGRLQRTWEESWEDQEAGYSRHQDAVGSSKTFHAWAVVELQGFHYVVDLSFEPSQLYLESSKQAAHYNRGRLGDVKKTGLTAAPLRSLREVKWHELTDFVILRDGGFGRVERAKYRGLEVVVKTPLSLDSYTLRTFTEEAQVLNLLSHPNIVKLVGVCTEKKAIVLDFVQGGDLHTFIKTQAALAAQAREQRAQGIESNYVPMTMLERLDMCIQTAIGMQYLHLCEPMITHRDLKTLNLLVSTVQYHPDELSPAGPSAVPRSRGPSVQKRVIKVCDFGLARNQHHDDGISTQHKDVGTPAFQSPEQWRDDEEERLTTATDVYSFGGIMMEILTDRMPWHTEKSKYAIYQHVMVEKRLPPIPADANLHPKLIECIDACHEFEPQARPTFPDVLRMLREVSDDLEEMEEQRLAAAASSGTMVKSISSSSSSIASASAAPSSRLVSPSPTLSAQPAPAPSPRNP